MEINISSLVGVGLWPYSGSQATHGTNAGVTTWRAAMSANVELLTSTEQKEAFRSHIRQMGMDETESMSSEELNAMLLQLVAAELRENGLMDLEDLPYEDNETNIFLGTDGEYYYQLG